MTFNKLDFSDFTGRKEALEQVIRYHSYKPMLYRTNLWMHTRRLVALLEAVSEDIIKIFPDWNIEKSRTFASIHDDAEIIVGDIQFGKKIQMTDKEMAALAQKEERAIDELTARFPAEINGFNYGELAHAYEDKTPDNFDAMIVKYLDKMDAYCEATHEVLAGNDIFIAGVGADMESPITVYKHFFSTFTEAWPDLQLLRDTGHPFFQIPPPLSDAHLQQKRTPHTIESIKKDTGLAHYEFWKAATLERMEDGLELLVSQRETE